MQMPAITAKFRRLKKVELVRFPPLPKGLKDLKINLKKPATQSFSKADKLQTWYNKTLLSSDLVPFPLSIYFNVPFHGLTFLEGGFSPFLLILSRRCSRVSGFNLWFIYPLYSVSLPSQFLIS